MLSRVLNASSRNARLKCPLPTACCARSTTAGGNGAGESLDEWEAPRCRRHTGEWPTPAQLDQRVLKYRRILRALQESCAETTSHNDSIPPTMTYFMGETHTRSLSSRAVIPVAETNVQVSSACASWRVSLLLCCSCLCSPPVCL